MAFALSYEPPADAAYALALVAALRGGGASCGGGGGAWADSLAPAPAAAQAPDRAAALAAAVSALRARRRARRAVARAAAAERRAALAEAQRAAPATAARAALQHPTALALLLRCALPPCEPLGAALLAAADAPLPQEAPGGHASALLREEGVLSGRRGGAARVAAPDDVPRLAAALAAAVAPPRAAPPAASGASGSEAFSGSPAAAVRTPGEPDAAPPAAAAPPEATACQAAAPPCAAGAMAVDHGPPAPVAAVATVMTLLPPPLLMGYQRQLLCAAPAALRLWDKAPLEPVGPACRVAYLVLCPRSAARAAASFCRELAAVYAAMHLGSAAPAQMPPGWPDAADGEALPGLMLLDDDAGVLDVDSAGTAALSASLRPCAGVLFLVAPRAGMLRALALAAAGCAAAERGAAGVTLHPLCLEALSLAAKAPQAALRPHALALHARAHRRPGAEVLADLAASDAATAAAKVPMPLPGRLPPQAPGAPRPRRPPPLAAPYCLAAAAHLPPPVDPAACATPAAPHLAAPWRLHVCYAPAGAAGTAVAWCAAGGTHLDADRIDAIAPAACADHDDVARALVDAVLRRACEAWAAVCGDGEDVAVQGGGRNDGLAITRLGAVPPAEASAWRAALALPWRCGAGRVTVCGVSGCVAAPLPPVGLVAPPPPPAATLVLLPAASGDDSATSASAMVVSRASGGVTAAAWWLAPPLSAGGAPRASCPLGVDIMALHACCEAVPPAGGARRAGPATPGEPTSDDTAAACTAAGAAAVPALAAALAALAACGAPVGAGAAAPPLPLHCGAAARAAGMLRLLHRLAERAGPPAAPKRAREDDDVAV